MKKVVVSVLFLALSFVLLISFVPNLSGLKSASIKTDNKFETSMLQEGDVIFQTSNYGQSLAVQKATESKYSHVGIVFKDNEEWYVYEAVQPVQKVKLQEFIGHGDQGHFTISRLKNNGQLSESKIAKMKAFFDELEGENYDIYFEWSDKTWYCSELVWKMYNHVGIKISEYEKFGQYNLTDPTVVKIINQRFKNGVNEEEVVITPRGIYESPEMKEIYTNY